MRARVVVGGVVSSIAVLVIGWQVGGHDATTASSRSTTAGAAGTSGAGDAPATGGSGTTADSPAATDGSSSSMSGTFTGTTAQTAYGPVQVQVVVEGGRITDVIALQLTDRDGRSAQISQQAAPVLRQEALRAQSAQIQAVSGATFTSAGYTTSLQSAIDQAGL